MSEACSLPNLLGRCGVGRRFVNAELSQFPQFFQQLGSTEESLFVTGPRGSGKTHYLCACLGRLVHDSLQSGRLDIGSFFFQGKEPVRFLSVAELMLECKQGNSLYNSEARKKYSRMEILVLDDFGEELVSDRSAQMLCVLLEHRYQNMKQTLISSQFSLSEIAKYQGERIASRIASMCKLIKFEDKPERGVEKNRASGRFAGKPSVRPPGLGFELGLRHKSTCRLLRLARLISPGLGIVNSGKPALNKLSDRKY